MENNQVNEYSYSFTRIKSRRGKIYAEEKLEGSVNAQSLVAAKGFACEKMNISHNFMDDVAVRLVKKNINAI